VRSYNQPFDEEVSLVKRREGHSGIYLLPNLLTTASLFAAFYSIVASLKGQYESAVIAIFIGLITDGLDGRIARMTNTQSAFGAEYDSLSDMVTFGVAPALLIYSWNLNHLGKLGWLVSFMYTAAVALRLARFNTQLETADKRYFQGIPCPPAATVISSFVWLCYQNEWSERWVSITTVCMAASLAVLMVSNVRYNSFKQVDFKGKVPFIYILLVVILFVAIASNPAWVIFIAFSLYASSGPLQTLFAIQRMRKKQRLIRKSRLERKK
jgi:CDP-diacylglycerol--serine O-phosphatidyltransferase